MLIVIYEFDFLEILNRLFLLWIIINRHLSFLEDLPSDYQKRVAFMILSIVAVAAVY